MSQLKFVGTNIDGLLGRAEQLKVHDRNLNDLIGQCSFTDALFHILLRWQRQELFGSDPPPEVRYEEERYFSDPGRSPKEGESKERRGSSY